MNVPFLPHTSEGGWKNSPTATRTDEWREWISIATRSTCTLYISVSDSDIRIVRERSHDLSPLSTSTLRITYSQRGWPPLFRPRSQFHHRVSFFFFFPTFVPKFHPAIVPPPRPREYTAFSRGLIPLNRDLVRLERDWFSLNKFQWISGEERRREDRSVYGVVINSRFDSKNSSMNNNFCV